MGLWMDLRGLCVRVCAAATLVPALVIMGAMAVPAVASGDVPGMPPRGKVLLGVGGASATPRQFEQVTGRRHHIHLTFLGWGQGDSWGSSFESWLGQAEEGDYRVMFHLGTRRGGGAEVISPGAIARGAGDDYLVAMSRALNESGQVAYVRPMAEMNGHWNPYSAFNANGSRRDANHSTAAYKGAFRRITIIMRGGSVADIDRRLAAAGLSDVGADEDLPASGNVAVVWNPQGEGSPNVRGNQPDDYYPGRGYVDYVANDLYAQGGRAHWRGQDALYRAYPQHPFMMAEWAPWGSDDPAFVDAMFRWTRSHRRTAALIYFNGSGPATFRLSTKSRSKARYRAHVGGSDVFRCDMCGTFGNSVG
jgi:hypothetical protein